MPSTKYIKVAIDDQEMDVESIESFPLAISYKLEERDDFQKKKSSEALSVKFPASLKNDQVANTFHNPAVEDNTADQVYKSARKVNIEVAGYEIFAGKAILKAARYTKGPTGYDFDFYGNNGDWMIPLQEATLFDFLQHISFVFDQTTVTLSWNFDGTDENLPYVFGPVRYREAMEEYPDVLVGVDPPMISDYNMKSEYMKPALSAYWIIYWAFKSLGYKVKSDFFDTDYFRRAVLLWTWGNFLYSEGTKQEILKFLAKSENSFMFRDNTTGFVDLKVTNDFKDGGFDNGVSTADPLGVYTYVGDEMKFTYLSAGSFGTISATFQLLLDVNATCRANSDSWGYVYWYKNGVEDVSKRFKFCNLSHTGLGRKDFVDIIPIFQTFDIAPTDVISARIYVDIFRGDFISSANMSISVLQFSLEYTKIILGSTIDFTTFTGLKKHKFLDYLRGVIDFFNLEVQTDPISKVVYFEPTHPYSLVDDQSTKTGGYFNGDFVDWDDKQDISKESVIENYADSERELIFRFKDDGNDGLLKTVQDRNQNILGSCKFVFPSRFKTGKKEIENRFFSPVMHYDVTQWKGLGTDPDAIPQMIAMVPENISNTSRDESQNTFLPKLAWYKGVGLAEGFVYDNTAFPYPVMFAVNYKAGGEDDPIFSYSDEQISGVVGKGLLRKFYLQRLAIMRNGQYHSTNFRLNNYDITNWFHREHIICRGQRWELTEINNYLPLKDESTGCFLRKWAPIIQADSDNVYPVNSTVLDPSTTAGSFDTKYAKLKCLPSDIPN